ncbi:hypothetical protein ASPACDRAFT_79169 [Aspergillus aculeatus ATCC 16872]|uniref:RRM domain-containing protein n=1 Tax=Aspergillus aculeatus (strain ATCC 16872 / CBS 172.66 / WB 5094) TaxID=690307 RepID=A0A1L9WSV2_ASPA1|nr:uncharacterized protein ASPACDRAFT_79169 [Aspergillus aculeatus ATCC 16872]OJJ99260.1 hypothetical protein ASPACDRAFT_79169 [Aspergillus aculeatus ATCC 16872]
MLKPFQIRDLHRSPSSSFPNEAADLDRPLSPTRRRGIVQLSASQYDNLSSSHPRARLTYLDEDDGELITVGSSLELSQRLEEPVDAELDPITAPQPALEPMHIFDIRRSNSVTELWKTFECKQETRETKDMNDATTESTPAEPSASTTHQTAEGSDSPQRDAHAADIEESESLLAAFEAEMAKFLSTSRPATGPTPPAESSFPSQSNSESRSARPQNAAEAFTHAMHSLIDGAELLSSGLMSRLPEIERQLQNAQRAIPENVGASVQGALAAVEAQLRQVTNSLNNSPAVTAQAAHILEGELPTATSTVESLRSMASELGNVGHTLFEAFEAELGCNRTRPHEQSSATSTEHRSSDNLVSDRNPEVTQARSTETSLETTDSTTGLETKELTTKEKNEAKDAGLQESAAQPRMSSNLDSSDPISEPSRRQTQSIRFPDFQPPMQPMHHSRRRPHPYPPPAPHPHHHPRAPPFPPFFHHPPPPHWQPPPGVPPSWPFSTLPELRNGYPSAPPPPPPPHFHLNHHPLDLRSHLHRGRHQGRYPVGPTNFSDVPADNDMGPTDVPPAACHARGVRPSEEGTALFIGNVGFDVSEKMITDVFASKGFLVDVHLPQESETGKHAGFGYLQFPTVHAAKAALDALQGEHIDGHAINLESSDHSPILGLRPQKARSQPESNQPVASATARTKRPSELQGSVASPARHSADEASAKRAVPLTVADLCSNDNRKRGDVVSSMNGLEIPSDDDADQLNILYPSLLPEGSPQPSRSNSIPSTLSDLTAEVEQRRFPPISQLEAQFRAMQCHQTAPAQSKTPDDGPKSLDAGLTSPSSSSTIPGTFPETSGDAAKPVETPSSSHHVPDELESQIGPRRHSRRSRSMKHPHSSLKGHGVGSDQVEPGPSHNFFGRPRPNFSHRARHHREPEGSSSQPQLTPTMRQTSIDACVATLVDLGYGGASDGGLQRIAVYAAAADANVLDAIDMIEEERKAYEQQGSSM